jgi:VWFA-related protein
MRPLFKLAVIAVCGVLGIAQSASPAQKPSDSEPVTTLKANTRVVLLDVVVNDKKGQPITDLTANDFTVLENGKPQKIASFNLMDKAAAVAAAAASAPPELPPGIYSNQRVLDPRGQITVLLLDALNTSFSDQKMGRLAMLKYFDEHPGERVAVFGLTSSLILLQDFTDDPKKLHKAIEARGMTQTALHSDEAGSASGAPVSTSSSVGLNFNDADNDRMASIQSYLDDFSVIQANARTLTTLEALQALGRWLRGYPGRKKLVWIAGNFPVALDPGEIGRGTNANPFVQEVKETATLLTDAQISVYAIDATGLKVNGAYFAQAGGTISGMQFGRAGAPNLTQVTDGKSALESVIASGTGSSAPDPIQIMKKFTEQTGGRAYYNRNDLDGALGASLNDGAVYYAISYSPDDKRWDGNLRKLEVKSNRPGVQLQYRRGYYALDPMRAVNQKQPQVDREVRTALLSPLLASGVSFYGSAHPSANNAKAPAKMHATNVTFQVNPRNFLFEPLEDGQQHCNVLLYVGVFSGNKLVTQVHDTLDGKWKPEAIADMVQRGGMSINLELNVPDDKVRLRLMMRDNRSGKMGALDIPYQIAAK